MSDGKAALSQTAEKLQQEIGELRRRLSELSKEKEALFGQRQDIGRQIASHIKELKEARSARDSLTGTVRFSKEEREKANEEVRRKIEELKQAKQGVDTTSEDPRHIKREIDKLNFKIETEVMSFEKEKELMKKIKALQKKHAEASKINQEFVKIHDLNKEISKLKTTANVAHGKVQEAAKESQTKHEALIASAKVVDDLKAKEDVLNKQIGEKKAAMAPIAAELDAKQVELKKLREQLGLAKEEEEKVTKEKKRKKLSELQAEVNAKLKKGEKLTTEDLLIMQSTPDEPRRKREK